MIAILGWWPFGQKSEDAAVPRRRWEARWAKRHHELCREAAKGTHQVVFVGDSITENWDDAGKSVWRAYYEDRNALNLGISSDRTQHVLWRLINTDFGEATTKLAVLLVGTNNSADNSPVQIADGVKAIVRTLEQKLPQAKILLLAIFPRGEQIDDPRRIVNQTTNSILETFADDERVFYLNINQMFTKSDGSTNLELMPDALHLNEAGYAIWAEAIEPTLQNLLDE